nr:hypothetical protein [uncultured Bacteroides sp.]
MKGWNISSFAQKEDSITQKEHKKNKRALIFAIKKDVWQFKASG